MKRFIYIIVALTTFTTACTADFEQQISNDGKKIDISSKIINISRGAIQGEIMVRFAPSAESRLAEYATRAGATRTGVVGVDAVLDNIGGYVVEPVFVVTEKNRDKVYAAEMHLWYVVKFDKESNLDSVAADLAKISEVKYLEFVHKVKRIEPTRATLVSKNQLAGVATSETRATSNIPFNDPKKNYMWGLDNQGTNSMVKYSGLFTPVVEADVNAVPAWKLCTGDPSIVVAVVDEGVMYSHEDLKDNYLEQRR